MERKKTSLSLSTLNKDNDDIIYYNVVMHYRNPGDLSPSIAEYVENRTQAIVDNPSEYQMSVIRFSIPSSELPIFIFGIQSFPNTNINLSTTSFTLSYGGTDVRVYLIYTPQTSYPLPNPPSAEHKEQYITPYYYVKTYQHMIEMMNTALSTAYDTLLPYVTYQAISIYAIGDLVIYNGVIYRSLVNGNTGNQPDISPVQWQSTQLPTEAPYFIYDSDIKKFSLIAQKQYDESKYLDPISIYTDHLFYTNFFNGSFLVYDNLYTNDDGKGIQFLVKNTNNNEYKTNYYQMKQEFSTIYAWNSFKSIVFMTGSIPIRNEFTPTQIQSGQNTPGLVNSSPILTDFEPPLESDLRTVLQYNPTAEYRMIDLIGTSPLVKFDIRVFWVDNHQNLYPIYIPAGENVTIKFLFRKKKYLDYKKSQ